VLGENYSAPVGTEAAGRKRHAAADDHRAIAAPRIYYISPLLIGPAERWPRVFARARGMGFDSVLIAPPFAVGRSGHLHATADFGRLHPVLAADASADVDAFIGALVHDAADHGLKLLIDLALDRLAADSPLLPAHAVHARAGDAPDPRRPMAPTHSVRLDFDSAALRNLAARQFPDLVARLAGLGVAGFRCLAPQHLPLDLWRSIIDRAGEDCSFLAWTPGLAPDVVQRLAEPGFAFSFASTPWWDLRSGWLIEEYEERRLTLPAIGLVEEPAGPRFAERLELREPAQRRRAARQQLAIAAVTGAGYLMPIGYELGARQPLDLASDRPADLEWLIEQAEFDLSEEIAAINAGIGKDSPLATAGQLRLLTGSGAAVTAVARLDGGSLRSARQTVVAAINPGDQPAVVPAAALLPALAGSFAELQPLYADGTGPVGPSANIILAPRDVAWFRGVREDIERPTARLASAAAAAAAPRLVIDNIAPGLGDGLVLKRLAGELLTVEADIFGDGHESLRAVLLWRQVGARNWQESEMRPLGNDRWQGSIPLAGVGRYVFTIEAWRDLFGSWREEVEKKHGAGLTLTLELQEGRALLQRTIARAGAKDAAALRLVVERAAASDESTALSLLLSEEVHGLMARCAERAQATRHAAVQTVMADRREASFASWYELFPRSWAAEAGRHGTFDDVIAQLPAIRAMGFDVLYFTPIHPIGRANRKGRNNALSAAADDPGSPYAIGGVEGGHDAVHPELGGLESFRRLLAAADRHGIEIALDFAIQCSPDHPWLKTHPGWFAWRPDGSLRYAENPPKKYEDIVNVDFYAEAAVPELWHALREVVLFWAAEGVRTFRVDNPHTKPLPFWSWLIETVQRRYPDALFLSEAFTRPRMMQRLAKVGFSQSYTYFTWRNTKAELTEYLTELTQSPMREYYRPHFFVNTPDINPYFLQISGRPGFLIRAALAATLSGLWGMYSGFEVCEARALPGREEYLDAEKYQLRHWDRAAPGNIVGEITRLNRIRRENPALQSHLGVAFLNCGNDHMLCYRKATAARDNVVLVVISLDPHGPQEASFEVPLWEFGMPDHGSVTFEDLMHETRGQWTGKLQHIRLDPAYLPFAIWRIAPMRTGA
jgi:starch synthase (maltosyl-transferring)